MSAPNMYLSIRDILAHKSTMFNFKLPSDRTMYESSLIYCNLCDYSCDLTDKSAIICHYLAKHPDDNIVYSYLWPQMEQNPDTKSFKVKYYLIKAHLKIRTKEGADLSKLNYPSKLLSEEEASISSPTELDDVSFVLTKVVDWVDKAVTESSSTHTQITAAQTQEDVQELEEEQEVQEVEMFGEDTYDAMQNITSANPELDELIRLSSSASYFYNQQKLNATSAGLSLPLENQYLVHLLAINKNENVFRVKQIHDYYGGCFVCGKQVDFNMKHYQTHFNSELTACVCLHCNYKEYKQEVTPVLDKTVKDKPVVVSVMGEEMSPEERMLQEHMSQCHSIDFGQILAQQQELQAQQGGSNGVVVIESTPMNDMYLSIQLKSMRYVKFFNFFLFEQKSEN